MTYFQVQLWQSHVQSEKEKRLKVDLKKANCVTVEACSVLLLNNFKARHLASFSFAAFN